MGRHRVLKLYKQSSDRIHYRNILNAAKICIKESRSWYDLQYITAWFLLYYNCADSYAEIARIMHIRTERGPLAKSIKRINGLLQANDIDVTRDFNTMIMLIEGGKTEGERLYVEYLKSNGDIFDYLTKDYKHDT